MKTIITTEQRRALARAYFADHCNPAEGPDAAAMLATMPDGELLERFELYASDGDTEAAALLESLGLAAPTERPCHPTKPDPAPGPARYRVESYADDPGRFYVYEFTPDGYEVIHAENLPSLEAAQAEAQRMEQAEALAAAAPDLLAELSAAHQIIRNALAVMTTEQKSEWGRLNERDHVDGEGITRANEREKVLTRATNGETAT